MNFPVTITDSDGQFTATLVGVPDVTAVGSSRPEALRLLENEVQRKISLGELATLETPSKGGVSAMIGAFADDPTIMEICEEAYAERDRTRPPEPDK